MALNDYIGPKFYMHECPFIPKNVLRSGKNFQDEHVLKNNMSFMDKLFNTSRKKRLEIINNENNAFQVNTMKHENDMDIYYYKRNNDSNKIKREINTKSKAHNFVSRIQESEVNSINHGRGKEKLLSPRKSIRSLIGRRGTRENYEHFNPEDEEVHTSDEKVSTVSNESVNSFHKSNFNQKNYEKNLTICAKINVTSDIPQHEQCGHQPKLDQFEDCKRHSRSVSFLDENLSESHRTEEEEKRFEKRLQQDLVLPKEAEEMKKLFCEKHKKTSHINDLYEEEEFLYDPKSRQVSHMVVMKSRSHNFLEYFKNTDSSSKETPMLLKEIQVLASKYLKAISLFQSDKSGSLIREEQNMKHSTLPLEGNTVLEKSTRAPFSFKELIANEAHESEYSRVEKHRQDELQEFRMDDKFKRTKSATLQCIHKRPELQKRYFYNEFKTYKKKYGEDDIFHSNEVKLTREKFEKILSKLIKRNKLHSALNNDKVEILESQSCESSTSLKKKQKFVSEENLYQRKLEEDGHVMNKSNDHLDESIHKQNGARNLQNSLLTVKFSPRKQDVGEKHPVPKLYDKTASVDDLLVVETNDYLTTAGKYNSKTAKSLSVDSLLHENFPEIKYFPRNQKDICDCDPNIGMVRFHADKKIHSILNVTQNNQTSLTYAQKSIKLPNQPEMIIHIQKKEDPVDGTNNHKQYKKKPQVKFLIKEGKEKLAEDPCYNQAVMDEIYHHTPDDLESFGRPISEEVLIKIRECGTSVTYFGGRIIRKEYGPMCSPMTMTILNEIKEYMSVLNDHFHKITDGERII